MEMPITITRNPNPRPKPDPGSLVFGKQFTDHMLLISYTSAQGWHDARIVPYGPLELDPASMVFHYGQAVFEGLKAFAADNGDILLFRPDKNMERMVQSCERLGIPALDQQLALRSITELLKVEQDWVPRQPGTSLYIRPFIIATEPCLGVRAATEYVFIVILSPVGAYYKGGLEPVAIKVEEHYVRAVRGGLGFAKTPANYAASLKAQEVAKAEGFAQTLWLDALEHTYIEEVGAMNMFFVINGRAVTPELSGSILDGVTRRSVIQLLQAWDIPVEERRLSIHEVLDAAADGTLQEAFGTGTAAVIAPVGTISRDGQRYTINDCQIGPLSQRLYNEITGIQNGSVADRYNWNIKIAERQQQAAARP